MDIDTEALTRDVVTAVSVMCGERKQPCGTHWGNWVSDDKRRFVWDMSPFPAGRQALTVVSEIPVAGFKDEEEIPLLINDVPHMVSWFFDPEIGVRIARIAENKKTRFIGFLADKEVVRWLDFQKN